MSGALALPRPPRRILLVRADGIGDHVLASGLLPLVRERFPGAVLTVACPDLVQDLFAACPWVDRVIPFNKRRLHRNPAYRLWLAARLRMVRADLALNTVHSRDSASDLLCRMSGAPVRVAHLGDGVNLKPQRKLRNDRGYTHLVEPGPGDATELDHHQRLLAFLGVAGEVRPTAWVSGADRERAARLLREHGLDGPPCLAFFPGTGDPIRFYGDYGTVLAGFRDRTEAGVVCLGGAGDRDWAEAVLGGLPGPKANLCGATSLPQAAAVLERCRLGFGAETGLAHLAGAVGTPHLVLLGGGFSGPLHAGLPPSPAWSACRWPATAARGTAASSAPIACGTSRPERCWKPCCAPGRRPGTAPGCSTRPPPGVGGARTGAGGRDPGQRPLDPGGAGGATWNARQKPSSQIRETVSWNEIE